MSDYREVQPHGDIEEVFTNVFLVTGTNVTTHEGIRYQTSRNMVIVRSDDGILSLINTVRLDENGLKSLKALGDVKHVIRIGAFHGYDDPFYVDTFDANYWIVPKMHHASSIKNPKELHNDSLPIQQAALYEFKTTSFAEGALWLEQDGGILITCDSVQNWTQKDPFFSDDCWERFEQQGLIGKANIPHTWVGACQPQKSDYLDLLRFKPFKHLISAHGKPLYDEASTKLLSNIEKTFHG